MEYLVVIHPAEEGGYWAEVPALGGCFAQGETVEDALTDVRGAIASHLEALREEGETPSADDRVIVTTVQVPGATAG